MTCNGTALPAPEPCVLHFQPIEIIFIWTIYACRVKSSGRWHCVRTKCSRLRPFETSGTTHPTTKRRISEDLNNQQHRCENLKSYGLYIIIFSKYQNIVELQRESVFIITSLCCFFSLRHRYAYEKKDPQSLPPPTQTQSSQHVCSSSYPLISKLSVTCNGENWIWTSLYFSRLLSLR